MLAAEARVETLTKEIAALDRVLGDSGIYSTDPQRAQNAAQSRGQLARTLETAEEAWLAATEAYETASATADA